MWASVRRLQVVFRTVAANICCHCRRKRIVCVCAHHSHTVVTAAVQDSNVPLLSRGSTSLRLQKCRPIDFSTRQEGGVRNSVFKAGWESLGRSHETIGVEDSELVHGRFPVFGCTPPISGDIAQCKPNEFRRCIIRREVTSRLDDLAQLRVDILNGVRSVYNLADVRWKRKERNHVIPGIAPRRAHSWVLMCTKN
ncbi:hypothetical protein PCE31107_00089 [Pandoraea cepalis]|uniref:Uncharacterized protein n=1 Tax=Pandoraea cepalis TaxID=2508294 RepID=A0A5E4RBZ7_9BURK|nr:hypothetical protein PCE31107_00089 [Pandoraea cepalis]